jgi:hypothetical protein
MRHRDNEYLRLMPKIDQKVGEPPQEEPPVPNSEARPSLRRRGNQADGPLDFLLKHRPERLATRCIPLQRIGIFPCRGGMKPDTRLSHGAGAQPVSSLGPRKSA